MNRTNLLLDIDGTLLLDSSAHLDSFFEAFEKVSGHKLSLSMIGETPTVNGKSVAGATDLGLLELICGLVGVLPHEEFIDSFFTLYAGLYQEKLSTRQELSGTAAPGLSDFLRLADKLEISCWISSGNARKISTAKLESAGILDNFNSVQATGFGDIHSTRNELVGSLLRFLLSSGNSLENIALVGDTEADMVAASAHGILGLGVSTGSATPEELQQAGASLVFSNLHELSSWAASHFVQPTAS